MKQLSILILLLFVRLVSYGQNDPPETFYSYLSKVLASASDKDTIKVVAHIYGCLGSQNTWSAEILPTKDLYRIEVYHDQVIDWNIPKDSWKYRTVLDTAFQVTKSYFVKNLDTEPKNLVSRPVFIEENFKFIILKNGIQKEFNFRRGEGLQYIFRYNTTMNGYFKNKNSKF